jgi:hypothetical protein
MTQAIERTVMDPKIHPLEDFVWQELEHGHVIDAPILAVALGFSFAPKTPLKAYHVVANDVLKLLLKAGRLVRTPDGWYVAAPGVHDYAS